MGELGSLWGGGPRSYGKPRGFEQASQHPPFPLDSPMPGRSLLPDLVEGRKWWSTVSSAGVSSAYVLARRVITVNTQLGGKAVGALPHVFAFVLDGGDFLQPAVVLNVQSGQENRRPLEAGGGEELGACRLRAV